MPSAKDEAEESATANGSNNGSSNNTLQIMALRHWFDYLCQSSHSLVHAAENTYLKKITTTEATKGTARTEVVVEEEAAAPSPLCSSNTPAYPSFYTVLCSLHRCQQLLIEASRAHQDSQKKNNNSSTKDPSDNDANKSTGVEKIASEKTELVTLLQLLLWFCVSTTIHNSGHRGGSNAATGNTSFSSSSTTAHSSAGHSNSVKNNYYNNNSNNRKGDAPYRFTGGSATTTNTTNTNNTNVNSNISLGEWVEQQLALKAKTAVGSKNSKNSSNDGFEDIGEEQMAHFFFSSCVSMLVSCSNINVVRPKIGAAASNNEQATVYGSERFSAFYEIHTLVLWLFSASLIRFTDCKFSSAVFLPVLFPEGSILPLNTDSDGVGISNASEYISLYHRPRSGQHPLLSPLLYGPCVSLRAASKSALSSLLVKSHYSLQYVEEPKKGRQPPSFVSLSLQGGMMLLSIHEAIFGALTLNHRGDASRISATGGKCVEAAVAATADAEVMLPPIPPSVQNVFFLKVFASAVVVTPYGRCPQSLSMVLELLEEPFIRDSLHEANFSPEYAATTLLLTNVFRNESLYKSVSLLFIGEKASEALLGASYHSGSSSQNSSQNTPRKETKRSNADPNSRRGSVSSTGAKKNTRTNSSGGSSSRHNNTVLMDELLTHAAERVEVWRCITQLARLYPTLIGAYYSRLLDASIHVIDVLKGGTNNGDNNTKGAPSSAAASGANNTAISSSHSSSSSAAALVECLRSWLHYMGYVWQSFDGQSGDPARRPECQTGRATTAQKVEIYERLLVPAMKLTMSKTPAPLPSDFTAGRSAATTACGTDEAAWNAKYSAIATTVLKCLAQLGQDAMVQILFPPTTPTPNNNNNNNSKKKEKNTKTKSQADDTPNPPNQTDYSGDILSSAVIQYVSGAISHPSSCPLVRAEALTTLGVWVWQYTCFDTLSVMSHFLNLAVSCLEEDEDDYELHRGHEAEREGEEGRRGGEASGNAAAESSYCARGTVGSKAAFALGNITSRLPPLPGDDDAVHVNTSEDFPLRHSPEAIQTLCDSAVTALHINYYDSSYFTKNSGGGGGGAPSNTVLVRSQGIRMMNHLLGVLSYEELLEELAPYWSFDDPNEECHECIGEGFCRILIRLIERNHQISNSNHSGGGGGIRDRHGTPVVEAKLRWNAVCALGKGLARPTLYEAEPLYYMQGLELLLAAVVNDGVFKVRTQAALALGALPFAFIARTEEEEKERLSESSEKDNAERKSIAVRVRATLEAALEAATHTENFNQFRERSALLTALQQSLEAMND